MKIITKEHVGRTWSYDYVCYDCTFQDHDQRTVRIHWMKEHAPAYHRFEVADDDIHSVVSVTSQEQLDQFMFCQGTSGIRKFDWAGPGVYMIRSEESFHQSGVETDLVAVPREVGLPELRERLNELQFAIDMVERMDEPDS